MVYLVYAYIGKSRDLRKIIVALLKSGLVTNVNKMNYMHNYQFKNNVVEKQEAQLLVVGTEDKNKLSNFLLKNFPQMERIFLG